MQIFIDNIYCIVSIGRIEFHFWQLFSIWILFVNYMQENQIYNACGNQYRDLF